MRAPFVLLLASVALGHVVPRASPSVVTLETIERDILALEKAGIDYAGGWLGAVSIERAESRLVKDLKQSTEAVRDQHPNQADSEAVVSFLRQRVEPDIRATTAALMQKRGMVANAGMTGMVHDAMVSLKEDVDGYFSVLLGSLHPSTRDVGMGAWTLIDGAIGDAIRQFAEKPA